ncbi:MAG TPA: dTDP-4-dehydrorhamnose 3,5-epimerase [Gemmatimonadales bacterium]|nr:dTDP-4-dehydrorhamnose 3,5-epimerase [Gemmatimonadales bacterium]
MKVLETGLLGVVVIEPRVFEDGRGFFFESYHAERYAAVGIGVTFVQDNHSHSIPGTIRGLHYQLRRPQAKLVRVVRGGIIDVAVDIRRGSPTFGKWVAVELTAANKRQLFIPAGFAHGFCVLKEPSDVEYKCSDYYAADDQRGIIWNDPTLAITWAVGQPHLSDKDRAYLPLTEDRNDLPVM